MYLRSTPGVKGGKTQRYFSIVESRRLRSGKVAQRQVLHLGEINDSQQAAWRKTLARLPTTDARCLILPRYTVGIAAGRRHHVES